MIDYGQIKSREKPQQITITRDQVLVASDISPYKEEIEGYTMEGYKYNYVAYTKDEYLKMLVEQNNNLQEQVLQTQMAVCSLYEKLGGDVL